MNNYILMFATVALTIYAQIVTKQRSMVISANLPQDASPTAYLLGMLTDPMVLSCLLAGVAATLAWFLAIQKIEIAYAYPFLALTFVLVPLASTFFLGEPFRPMQFVAAAIIVLGISLHALAR
jgi:drug/metabolite transporter (DMT)-like permease